MTPLNLKRLLTVLSLFSIHQVTFAQTVDLSSVDEFFQVTSTLLNGKEISAEQWRSFDRSSAYREFAERTDSTLINTIRSSIYLAFGNGNPVEKERILNIPQEEMNRHPEEMLQKLILINYLDVNDHYSSLRTFREQYDFQALVEKARDRLRSFLEISPDSVSGLKPVYFLFISADGKNKEEAIYLDFNLIYKKTEAQRADFLAHEYFHNFRERYENHDFNYKNYLNYSLDAIQNEGIADLIDKTGGYGKYFTEAGEPPEMVATWVRLYDQAQEDLERLQQLVMKYAKGEMTEAEMEEEIQDIVRFNGHPIGFFMASHIVSAGYSSEMLTSFYDPNEFYRLYNEAARKQGLFQLSEEFLSYVKGLTGQYYH